MAQTVGTVTCLTFVFVTFYAFFKIVEVTIGNRVSAEAEMEGLDVPEMGVLGYPEFTLAPGSGVTMIMPIPAAAVPVATTNPARDLS